jgi:tetratricopeptide (TPR) repeat protein
VSRSLRWYHATLLIGLVVLVHGLADGGGFHYDDAHAVVDNPHIRTLSSIPRFFVDPALFSVDPERGMYRPVLLASYAVGHALHGNSAAGYLTTNLAIHAANALLVAAIATGLGGSLTAALLAGALFAVHPVATEPVHYVSARSDSLVALFLMTALALWLRADTRSDAGGRYRFSSWIASAAALWTKATALCLPATLLLLDLARGITEPARLARRHGVVWALTVLYAALSWWTDFLPRSLAAPSRPLLERLLTQAKAAVYYLQLLIAPVQQSTEPQFSSAAAMTAAVSLAVLMSASLLAGAAVLRHRGGWQGLFLVGAAALSLLPTALAPLNVLVNERRAYLPLAMFAIAVAVLASRLPAGRRPASDRFALGAPVQTVMALAVVAFSLLAHARGAVWASDLTLWQDAARKSPAMARAQLYLGDAHLKAGQATGAADERERHSEAARRAYERVLTMDPTQRLLTLQAHNGLSILEAARGDLQASERRLLRVLEESPTYVDGLVNLGNVHYERARRSRGRDDASMQRAIELFELALTRAPGRFETRLNLGAAYHLAGDWDRAQSNYELAAALAPHHGTTSVNLGNLFLGRARKDPGPERRAWLLRAKGHFEHALTRLPDSEAARRGLQAVAEGLSGDLP